MTTLEYQQQQQQQQLTNNKRRHVHDDSNNSSNNSSKKNSKRSHKKRLLSRMRRVTWAQPFVHEQQHRSEEQIDPSQIWYSRKDYDNFLQDRVQTVRMLRANAQTSPDYCIRGLEPFQSERTHIDLHSNRESHTTSILLEQLRQNRLQICQPERYPLIAHSQWSLQKAQQQALLDEFEVYGSKRLLQEDGGGGRRGSFLSAILKVPSKVVPVDVACSSGSIASTGSTTSSTTSSTTPSSNNNNNTFNCQLSSSTAVRRLQELNTRRLMQLYQQTAIPTAIPPPLKTSTNDFFTNLGSSSRFRIRRDSLFGSCPSANTEPIMAATPTIHPIGQCLTAASNATNMTRQLLNSSQWKISTALLRRDSLSMPITAKSMAPDN